MSRSWKGLLRVVPLGNGEFIAYSVRYAYCPPVRHDTRDYLVEARTLAAAKVQAVREHKSQFEHPTPEDGDDS